MTKQIEELKQLVVNQSLKITRLKVTIEEKSQHIEKLLKADDERGTF